MKRQWVQLDEEPAANIPMTLYYMGAGLACRRIGQTAGPVVLIYHGRSVRECVAKGGFAGPGRKILERLENDRSFLSWMWRRTRRLVKPFLSYSKKIFRTDLSALSNAQLVGRYEKWSKQALAILSASTFGTVMEFEEPILSGPLYEQLQRNVPAKSSTEPGTVFTLLTTPLGANENRAAEIRLIELALAVPQKMRRIIIRNPKVFPAQINPKIRKQLKSYHDRYSYLAYGYSGPVKSFEETVGDFLGHLFQAPDQLRARLHELKKADPDIRQKQSVWINQLKLDAQSRRRFQILRDIGGLKRWRKKCTVQGQFLIHGLLVELARRLGVPLLAIQSLAPWEMRDAIIGKKPSKETLIRKSRETVVWLKGCHWKTLSASKAKAVINEIDKSLTVKDKPRQLQGMCACAGSARGRVVILRSASDLLKFDKGNIIVSPATSPELVPAMRQAAAIVTDAGGITSHAAIVSRELNVPCVIGTKIATHVFRNGDRVEVDATKGVVRKL